VRPEVTSVGTFSSGSVDYEAFKCILIASDSAEGRLVKNTYTIYGDSEEHGLEVPAAFQVAAPFGTNIGGGNPAFFRIKPESEFDSWISVGVDSSNGQGANQNRVTSIGVPFGGWSATAGMHVVDGALFWMDPDNALPTPTAVGQISVPVSTAWRVKLSARGKANNGPYSDWVQEDIVFCSPSAGCGE
jgi:hypothetical protein